MARPVGSIISAERLIAGLPFNFHDAVKRYLSGEGLEPLAESLGTTYGRLKLVFLRAGIQIRNRSDAMRTRLARMGPGGRAALTEAAHNAVRGRKRPADEVDRFLQTRAISLAKSAAMVGKHERRLISMLEERGLNPTPQFPVWRYNIDIAIFPIAVEVHTGTGHPLNITKLRKRMKYLCDRGWWIIYVRATKHRPLSEDAADQIVSRFEFAQRQPAGRGKYRVIWGSGEFSPREGMRNHKRTAVDAAEYSPNS